MLADVAQANTHINALIGFVVVSLYRLEGGPGAILQQQSHKFEFSGRLVAGSGAFPLGSDKSTRQKKPPVLSGGFLN
jgi:hypothetical protein